MSDERTVPYEDVKLVREASLARALIDRSPGAGYIVASEGLKWLLGEDAGYNVRAVMESWVEAGRKVR